jgi:hypothetical protein
MSRFYANNSCFDQVVGSDFQFNIEKLLLQSCVYNLIYFDHSKLAALPSIFPKQYFGFITSLTYAQVHCIAGFFTSILSTGLYLYALSTRSTSATTVWNPCQVVDAAVMVQSYRLKSIHLYIMIYLILTIKAVRFPWFVRPSLVHRPSASVVG